MRKEAVWEEILSKIFPNRGKTDSRSVEPNRMRKKEFSKYKLSYVAHSFLLHSPAMNAVISKFSVWELIAKAPNNPTRLCHVSSDRVLKVAAGLESRDPAAAVLWNSPCPASQVLWLFSTCWIHSVSPEKCTTSCMWVLISFPSSLRADLVLSHLVHLLEQRWPHQIDAQLFRATLCVLIFTVTTCHYHILSKPYFEYVVIIHDVFCYSWWFCYVWLFDKNISLTKAKPSLPSSYWFPALRDLHCEEKQLNAYLWLDKWGTYM